MEIEVSGTYQDERVDKFLTEKLKKTYQSSKYELLLSREFVKKAVVPILSVNGRKVKPSYRLGLEDLLLIDDLQLKGLLQKSFKELEDKDRIVPEIGELDIIDETDDYLLINKPHNMVVHPGIGHSSGTLANYVKGYLKSKDQYDPLLKRSGIVHRLDKPVSGLILFAKDRKFQLFIKKQFEEHKVFKLYTAEVSKLPDVLEITSVVSRSDIEELISSWKKDKEKYSDDWVEIRGFIDRDNNNRKRMKFDPIFRNERSRSVKMYISKNKSKEVYIRIITGRMHQIRATLSYYDSTVIGDSLYEKGEQFPDQISLRSIVLGFNNGFEKVIYTL